MQRTAAISIVRGKVERLSIAPAAPPVKAPVSITPDTEPTADDPPRSAVTDQNELSDSPSAPAAAETNIQRKEGSPSPARAKNTAASTIPDIAVPRRPMRLP